MRRQVIQVRWLGDASLLIFRVLSILSLSLVLKAQAGGSEPPISTGTHYNRPLIIVDANGLPITIAKTGDRFESDAEFESAGPSDGSNNGADSELSKIRLELLKFRKRLESTVFGAPEVIDRLYQVEVSNRLYGQGKRTLPVVALYMLGPPGTGKSLTAKSYVDAIHGRHGAYIDHLYSIEPLKNNAELQTFLGSPTGYIGSTDMPKFIRWLANHSGGRYVIKERKTHAGKTEEYIVDTHKYHSLLSEISNLNEAREPSIPPEQSVVEIDEFHLWSKEAKTQFFHKALEDGYFPIKSPNGGEDRMYVPLTFILSSNEGAGLIIGQEKNGNRIGRPPTTEQGMEAWQRTHDNIGLILEEILKTNGAENSPFSGYEAPGILPETLNRIPKSAFKLMRPLTHETVVRIVAAELKEFNRLIASSRGVFRDLEFVFSEDLVEYLAKYHYSIADGARPIADRIRTMIKSILEKAYLDESLPPTTSKKYAVTVEANPDGTSSLVVSSAPNNDDASANKTGYKDSVRLLIESTIADRHLQVIPDAELDRLSGLGTLIKQHVFGIDPIVDQLEKAMLISAEEGYSRSSRSVDNASSPARVFMFLGLSSVGKTETAKELHKALFGDSAFKSIDFSAVTSKDDINELIVGTRDSIGNSKPSAFMKDYDTHGGRLVYLFDEVANAGYSSGQSAALLTPLYDLLREPVARIFTDKKERPMGGVTIIMAGNAGQELFLQIPKDLSDEERQDAWEQIYQDLLSKPDMRRALLENYFSPAFLNRVGEQNIFFFPPLSFKARRELTQLKLLKSLERLKPQDGQRGWSIVFKDLTNYKLALEQFDTAGFVLEEQGASIDRFLRTNFEWSLKAELLARKVPVGASVVLQVKPPQKSQDKDNFEYANLAVEVYDDQSNISQTFDLELKGKHRFPNLKISEQDQIITAYHEIGHELVSHLLFSDVLSPDGVKIIPGATLMGGKPIRYLGIASKRPHGHYNKTRKAVLYEMAWMAAGYVAQEMVTEGSISDAGKFNDMSRATALAHLAILRWGLSPTFGRQSISDEVTVAQAIQMFSDQKRLILEHETDILLKEAEQIARRMLLANYGLFSKMAISLAEKGELTPKQIKKFYRDYQLRSNLVEIRRWIESNEGQQMQERFSDVAQMGQTSETSDDNFRDARLRSFVLRPHRVANIAAIVRKRKHQQTSQIQFSSQIPIFQTSHVSVSASKTPNRVTLKKVRADLPPKAPREPGPTIPICSSVIPS